MLPNWLYGKSKSKLASILGGGGGAPADYDQVKAQVTQNAEDIALLDTNTQALTNAFTNNVNANGSKNILPNYVTPFSSGGADVAIDDDDIITVTASSALTDNCNIYPAGDGNIEENKRLYLPKGTYIGSGCPSGGSASTYYVHFRNQSTSTNLGYDYGEGVEFTLDSDTWIVVRASVRNGYTISDSIVFKPMITLATDVPSDYAHYVPYAMTNRELTEKLIADANLGTAVDLSTYTAYSNMYTAPSDGYVHFLSAASGSSARTIYTYGNNTTAATDSHFTHSTSANNKAFEIFIKKGLKIYADGLQTGDTINFYPLT